MGLIPAQYDSVLAISGLSSGLICLSLEAGFIPVEGPSLRSTGPRAAVIRYQTYSSRYVMVTGTIEREKALADVLENDEHHESAC